MTGPSREFTSQADAPGRARLLALPEAIAVATPARREELCRILVERITVRDREIETIDRTPQARPFFERLRECPPRGFGDPPAVF